MIKLSAKVTFEQNESESKLHFNSHNKSNAKPLSKI